MVAGSGIVESVAGWGSAPLFTAAVMAALIISFGIAEAVRWWKGRR